MEVCAAKKPKWETAVVSVKTGAKTLEEESDISASGILQQMAAQAFQDISSLGVLQNETTQYSTTPMHSRLSSDDYGKRCSFIKTLEKLVQN